jgi:hypothetical protein
MAINFNRLEDITRALKTQKQSGKSFHTCFVYHGSKLINISHNNYDKLHPYHKWTIYKPNKDTGNYNAGIHAELQSLVSLGLTNCSHLTFVNVRVDNNDKPAISKACKNCERLLRTIGIKAIWYYDGVNYVKEKY